MSERREYPVLSLSTINSESIYSSSDSLRVLLAVPKGKGLRLQFCIFVLDEDRNVSENIQKDDITEGVS